MPKSNKSATPAKKPAPVNKGKPSAKPAASKPAPKPTPKPASKAPPKPAAKAPEKKPAQSAPPSPAHKPGKKPEVAPLKAPSLAPAPAHKPESKAAVPAKGAPVPSKTAPAPAKGAPILPKGAPAPVKNVPATPVPAATVAKGPVDPKAIPPKGITVVQRPMRKPKPKKLEMPISEPLLKPGGKWKPLIPSGPKAPPTGLIGQGAAVTNAAILSKNKLAKKELDKYREILLHKRSELVGDISNIEDEALRQNSGSLSNVPQHMAEQGSDTFDQSISLDLAQVDRNLIREIDEALQRIDEGTYGVCLRTGQRISAERLAEIPWAKYSIEAQRDLERHPFRHTE